MLLVLVTDTRLLLSLKEGVVGNVGCRSSIKFHHTLGSQFNSAGQIPYLKVGWNIVHINSGYIMSTKG